MTELGSSELIVITFETDAAGVLWRGKLPELMATAFETNAVGVLRCYTVEGGLLRLYCCS